MSIQNMKRSETTEQIALFNWAKRTESILPELALMYHVPNEGKRSNGGILKAAGLKSGVPDICLPVANNGFHGLYIELKFGKNKATKAQEEYMAMLNAQGYKTAVCYGAEEAGEEILAYLTEPGRMPKKACVNAPWINGKCDGINLPSRMFSREECRGCKNFNPGREERIINEILSEHPEKREIKQAIINLSCGQTGNKKIESMEDTLEIINATLGGMVKGNELTVEQSAAVLTERAESLGLPITKNAFEGTLENPVPPLPYMVYLLPREATAGADSRPNNLMADDWQLELYTVADDETAEEIRTRIENEVLHDVDYVKFVAYVDSEECFQTAYEVTGLLRKARK